MKDMRFGSRSSAVAVTKAHAKTRAHKRAQLLCSLGRVRGCAVRSHGLHNRVGRHRGAGQV